MKILGIDPGTGRLGWAILSRENGRETLIDCGCLETPSNSDSSKRLKTLFDFLEVLITTHQPDQAAVEELFFSKNVTTAMKVSEARGVILLALERAGVPTKHYNPTQIKMAVTGYGKADKKQVQHMVKLILRLVQVPKPDDAADAIAVALTHSASNPKLT